MPVALRLAGELDAGALAAALADVVGRHEVLRTVFPADGGQPCQQVLDPAGLEWGLRRSPVGADELAGAVAAGLRRSRSTWRRRCRCGRGCCGWARMSMCWCWCCTTSPAMAGRLGPLARDLSVAYAARRAGAGAGVGAAAGAVRRLRAVAAGAARARTTRTAAAEQVAYWRQALAGAPEELALPADRPRPAVPSHRGHAAPLAGPAPGARGAGRAGPRAGRDDVHGDAGRAGGAAVPAGRGRRISRSGRRSPGGPMRRWMTWSGSSSTRWCCAPTCPGTRRSTQLLGRVREAGLGALEHQDVPFERLVEVLAPARSLARHPLFQVDAHRAEHRHRGGLELPGCAAQPPPRWPLPGTGQVRPGVSAWPR